ncbi:hypothetical protein PF005_g22346 [Phytophthora fragariae]|uniref:RxLR effector protein n=1 Tax=Phytophthora fragariae TaxID=53985 RepID=A0A6A3XAA5_9STRA|nr:hypothetical protein PF003_g19916 [Phytophthora fragariae]KAE8926598.1 hypothetical protein PF009_g23218 [Phytophthora fragariae]KAE8983839.1 hypothetical protein PF011_g21018 [Phytophthora fragariae]KAE9081581.1 hypothetical protein PF010_g21934 [Phytophthora fragariae]KAE9082204.1 hypothetical protein PF007_g22361 [Phytophthora fragariae]
MKFVQVLVLAGTMSVVAATVMTVGADKEENSIQEVQEV